MSCAVGICPVALESFLGMSSALRCPTMVSSATTLSSSMDVDGPVQATRSFDDQHC